jgi:hypothetical protein
MSYTATNRPAGEHHDREQDDRHAERHGDGVDPLRLLGEHDEDDRAAAEDRPVPRHLAIPDHWQLLEEVVAQRDRTAAEDHHHDDHEERQRGSEPLLIESPPDDRLADAEREAGRRGDREGAEVTHECGGERSEHERGHRSDLERDDRHDEHAGDGGDAGTERPVQHSDAVGGDADGGRRPLALGHRLGREPELGRAVEEPEQER